MVVMIWGILVVIWGIMVIDTAGGDLTGCETSGGDTTGGGGSFQWPKHPPYPQQMVDPLGGEG